MEGQGQCEGEGEEGRRGMRGMRRKTAEQGLGGCATHHRRSIDRRRGAPHAPPSKSRARPREASNGSARAKRCDAGAARTYSKASAATRAHTTCALTKPTTACAPTTPSANCAHPCALFPSVNDVACEERAVLACSTDSLSLATLDQAVYHTERI